MTLNYVTLLIASQDAGQDATAGQVSITPTSEVIAAGVAVVSSQAVVRALSGGAVSVQLVATDNAGTSPASRNWAYKILLPGETTALEYYVDFANGASQRLDNLTPLNGPPAVLSAVYMPLPGGTATAGYVPGATGTGEASTWVPNGTGGSGYPSSPVVSGTPSAGNVLTATDATHATWQPPAAGGGTVTSVSVATANGFAGTVATATTTPAISVQTSVTGLLKGNGTAVSAATSGTDYAPATSGSAILKGNGSGGFSSAAAGTDYVAPTGSGAGLTGITASQVGAVPSALMTTLGDIIYENSAPAPARLAGNTTAAKQFLTQTGTGTVSAAPAWGAIQAADVPTLNQSTTGTAANVTGTVAIANGGTGQATQQAALDALAGAVTSGQYLRGNGTHVLMAGISAGDVPTLNQSTTGTAANFTGGATLPAYLAPKATALTDGATISVDASLGNYYTVTLGGNRTMAAPTNAVAGDVITIAVAQDGTGSRTLTWTSGAGGYSFGTDGSPTLTTTASAVDEIAFRYHAGLGKWLCQGWKLGFS